MSHDHVGPAAEEEADEEDGLGHYGDADQEVIVIEEPRGDIAQGPRVIKAPAVPTQKEIDAHMATHLPHQSWCDICMYGEGRNTLHSNKNRSKPASTPNAEVGEASEAGVGLVDPEASATLTGAGAVGALLPSWSHEFVWTTSTYQSELVGLVKGPSPCPPQSCERDSSSWGGRA